MLCQLVTASSTATANSLIVVFIFISSFSLERLNVHESFLRFRACIEEWRFL
jgi:hypothetical protein